MSKKTTGIRRWVTKMATEPNGGLNNWRSYTRRWGWTSIIDREIRHVGASVVVANFHDKGQLHHFRLAVPEFGTFWLLRRIRKILDKQGVPYLTLARDARDQAVIKPESITVIDRARGNGLIPGDTLFKAKTRASREWWDSRPWLAGIDLDPTGKKTWREAYFISGFDRREPGVSYFLCELPPSATPTSLAEAFEALKPGAVRVAEQMGRKVKRQGDIFFIPAPTVTPQGEVWTKAFIDGSNHRATEMIEQDGVMYVRGNVVHAPTGRRPDHFPVRIGRTWHIAIKNTVPRVA